MGEYISSSRLLQIPSDRVNLTIVHGDTSLFLMSAYVSHQVIDDLKRTARWHWKLGFQAPQVADVVHVLGTKESGIVALIGPARIDDRSSGNGNDGR